MVALFLDCLFLFGVEFCAWLGERFPKKNRFWCKDVGEAVVSRYVVSFLSCALSRSLCVCVMLKGAYYICTTMMMMMVMLQMQAPEPLLSQARKSGQNTTRRFAGPAQVLQKLRANQGRRRGGGNKYLTF